MIVSKIKENAMNSVIVKDVLIKMIERILNLNHHIQNNNNLCI